MGLIRRRRLDVTAAKAERGGDFQTQAPVASL